MASNFLTPTVLWKDYVKSGFTAETVYRTSAKGVTFTHVKIHADNVAGGSAHIYGVLAHKSQLGIDVPAVLLIQDFKNGADESLARFFAEKGYVAFAVDLAGAADFSLLKTVAGVDKPFTEYSDNLSYAVYEQSTDDKAQIEGDVRSTCWYVWGRVIRICAEYLTSLPFVGKTGVVGIGSAATALWQVLSADCGFSCAVVVANAGWKGYRGVSKFGEVSEPKFGDEALKYLAGIEPQAYAAHVKCPLMLVAPTNSPYFDIDRAYDTVSRVKENLYTAVDYSVGSRWEISAECFNGALTFLKSFLESGAVLPEPVSVKGFAEGDAVNVEVLPDTNDLKNVCVYFSEGELSPKLRSWQKVSDYKQLKNGAYCFEYFPYNKSENVLFFARAEYSSGMFICSPVFCKKTALDKSVKFNKHRVLYSSRMPNGANGFYPAVEKNAEQGAFEINSDKNSAVKIKSGPMEILGLSCTAGIVTFKINVEKFKPEQGAMFMLDVFVKGGGNLTVKAVTDYFGCRTEYVSQIKVFGDLWQNVQLESTNFKTEEGMSLKSYENVQALEFYADNEFCINNLLWL